MKNLIQEIQKKSPAAKQVTVINHNVEASVAHEEIDVELRELTVEEQIKKLLEGDGEKLTLDKYDSETLLKNTLAAIEAEVDTNPIGALENYLKMFEGGVKFDYDYVARSCEIIAENGNPSEVLSFLDTAISYDDTAAALYNVRGWVKLQFRMFENYQDVIADFSKTIELNPKELFAHDRRALAILEMGGSLLRAREDYQEEEKLHNPYLQNEDLNNEDLNKSYLQNHALLRWNIEMRFGNYQELANNNDLVQLPPEQLMHLLDEAVQRDLNAGIKSNFLHHLRGAEYFRQRKLKESIAEFSQELEHNPNALTYFDLAEVHFEAKNYEKMLENLNKASEFAPFEPTIEKPRADVVTVSSAEVVAQGEQENDQERQG